MAATDTTAVTTIEPGDELLLTRYRTRYRVVEVRYRPVMRYYHLVVCDVDVERPRRGQLRYLNHVHL